jgi:Uncharacterized conserved protein
MKRIEKVLLVISILLILDTVAVISLNAGYNLGNILPAITGFILLIYITIRQTKLYKKHKISVKKIEKLVASAFALWFVSFVVIISIMIASSVSNKNESTDCILILGAGLHGDVPSLVLLERLDMALDYIKQNQDIKVIASGGQGPGENITEAEAMKKYLINHGIPDSDIVKEEKSTSTMENFKYSKTAFKEQFGFEMKKIMIVTSDFHMFRSKLLARRNGLTPFGLSAKTPFYIYPNVYIREYFALAKSIILDK